MSTFDDMMRIADEMKIDGVCRKISVIRWRSSLHFLCSAACRGPRDATVGPAYKLHRRLVQFASRFVFSTR